jgi:hypothetical protein
MDPRWTLSRERWSILLEVVSLFLITLELYSDEHIDNALRFLARAEPWLAPLARPSNDSEELMTPSIPTTPAQKLTATFTVMSILGIAQRLAFVPMGLIAVIGLRLVKSLKGRVQHHAMIRTISILGGVLLFLVSKAISWQLAS